MIHVNGDGKDKNKKKHKKKKYDRGVFDRGPSLWFRDYNATSMSERSRPYNDHILFTVTLTSAQRTPLSMARGRTTLSPVCRKCVI